MKTYCHDEYPYMSITEIPLDDVKKINVEKCEEPIQTPMNYYNSLEKKPDVIVNGGLFYLLDGSPVLTLMDEGKLEHHESWLEYGLGIVGDRELINGELYDGHNYRDFVSGYPVLIKNGEKQVISYASELNYLARRTVIAWNEEKLFVITVDSPGMLFGTLQNLLLGLEVENAVNLDGGGSTCKIVKGALVTDKTYKRAVDNVICVYLYKRQKIYRVQAGAFRSKANAENLRSIISKIDDKISAGYKNTFIKLVDGLYKVQIGAFTNKVNAQKVVTDLKRNKQASFIVEEYIEIIDEEE